MKENFLDKTISWFSPEAGYKRMQFKKAQDVVRQYDGAKTGRRTANWRAPSSSANAEVKGGLVQLRNRSRDLVRNEGYAERALSGLEGNIIGEGIIASINAKTTGRQKIWLDAWLKWAETDRCDFDGLCDFYGLQGLGTRSMCEGGSFLLVKRKLSEIPAGMNVPLKIQVLEGDYIDTTKDGESYENGEFCIQGVIFNKSGQRVGYWLFNKHPGETSTISFTGNSSVRVSADDVVPIFRVDRIGQVHGIPWFAPILVKFRDLSDYSDATLMRAKIAACFTAFVKNTGVSDLSTGTTTPPIGETMTPGQIEILGQDQDIEFANPPTAGDFGSFSKEQLRSIAAGIGVTYEILTGDYSQVNFSSGRMGWVEFHRSVKKWQQRILIPRMNRRVWDWFNEAAILAGMGSDPVYAGWTPPRREQIDPLKETLAQKEKIKGGLMSRSEAIRENGYEPREVNEEIKKERDEDNKQKLVFDTDAANDLKAPIPAEKKEEPKEPKDSE